MIKKMILNLPFVKAEINKTEKDLRQEIERLRSGFIGKQSELQAKHSKKERDLENMLHDENMIKNKYLSMKDKHIFLDTQVVEVKKGKARYTLIAVKTKHGEYKINVGRFPYTSDTGIGEHSPINS